MMRSTLVEQPLKTEAPESSSTATAAPSLKVRILGCSGGIGKGLRTTSLLLNHNVLIDMGTGVGDLTLEELNQIDTVFLTHSHLDHTAMLPLFLDTTFDSRVDRPLTVFALAETIEALRAHFFNNVIWPDFERLPSPESPVVRFVEIQAGDKTNLGGYSVLAIKAFHSVPSLGYCMETNGRVFAFSGDTTTNEALWPVLNRYPSVEVLVVEVSFPNAQEDLALKAGHYCPRTLAEDVLKLRHTPKIWVTAMKPGFQEQIFAEVKQAIPDHDIRRLLHGDVFSL